MAIKPIRPLYSPSATATNGSDTITVTGNVDCSYIYDGFLVSLGTRQVVEAVRGTSPDGSGNSTITLRRNWDAANTTAPLLGWNSIEGLPAAVNTLRETIGQSAEINSDLIELAQLTTTGVVRKTGAASYQTINDTTAGRTLLTAANAAAQRTALGVLQSGTANGQARTNLQNDERFDRISRRELLEKIERSATVNMDFANNEYKVYESPELSFVKKPLTDIMTTTRASSGSVVTPYGVATVSANLPRLTFNPETGEAEGLLCEEQRTNLLLWSEDFTQSAWAKTNGLIVTPTSLQGWIKGTTFTEINDSEPSIDRNLRQVVTSPNNNSTYVAWGIFKKSDSPVVSCRLALTGGTAVFGSVDYDFDTDTFGSSVNITTNRVLLGGGAVLLAWSINNNSSGNTAIDVRFYSRPASGGTGKVYINAIQLEEGSFPTSYIKTEASQVTRGRDTHTIDVQSGIQEWTVFVEVSSSARAASTPIVTLTNSDGNQRVSFEYTSGRTFVLFTRSDNINVNTISSVQPSSEFIGAFVFKGTSCKAFVNGELAASVTMAGIVSPDQLLIGYRGGANTTTAVLDSVKAIPHALSDEDLLELTRL